MGIQTEQISVVCFILEIIYIYVVYFMLLCLIAQKEKVNLGKFHEGLIILFIVELCFFLFFKCVF